MTTSTQSSGDLNWLLDDLVGRVAALRHAVILSGDGLATGASRDLAREDAEHLAAVAAGFHSLAKGAAWALQGRWRASDHGRAGRGLPVHHRGSTTAAAWRC